jgi:hypothetical protein
MRKLDVKVAFHGESHIVVMGNRPKGLPESGVQHFKRAVCGAFCFTSLGTSAANEREVYESGKRSRRSRMCTKAFKPAGVSCGRKATATRGQPNYRTFQGRLGTGHDFGQKRDGHYLAASMWKKVERVNAEADRDERTGGHKAGSRASHKSGMFRRGTTQ